MESDSDKKMTLMRAAAPPSGLTAWPDGAMDECEVRRVTTKDGRKRGASSRAGTGNTGSDADWGNGSWNWFTGNARAPTMKSKSSGFSAYSGTLRIIDFGGYSESAAYQLSERGLRHGN